MNRSTLTDAERSYLAHISYPVSRNTPVAGNTGNWMLLDSLESQTGLEIYALRKLGTQEVVFVTRGSDCIPDAAADWSPIVGANISFAGSLHPQLREAIKFVDDFREEYKNDNFIYSTAGHSKGAGDSQVLSYTFGFEGTAIDPAPAGAIVESREYLDYLQSLDIEPKGIPEHGFTNYVEKGSLVGDTLENLNVFGFGTGAHLGDTVKVDMAPGSWWNFNSSVLEQHSTVDDTFSQVTQGAAYIVGRVLEDTQVERQQLIDRQAQLLSEQEVVDGSDRAAITHELIGIEQSIKEYDREIANLTVIRLNKIQKEYGAVDNWMAQSDFQAQNPSPQTIENLYSYYQKGISDVIDDSLYLNSKELLSLEAKGEALQERIAAGDNTVEGDGPLLESQLNHVNSQIEEVRGRQQELLQLKYGDQLDSWMRTDSFLEKAIPWNSALDSLSNEDKAIIQNPDTLQKLLHEQEILKRMEVGATQSDVADAFEGFHWSVGELASPSGHVIQPGDPFFADKQPNTIVDEIWFGNPEIGDPEEVAATDENSVPTDGAIAEASLVTDHNSSTFLGFDAELWSAMSKIAEEAQKVEQVGDDITALIQAFQQGNDWDAFEATVNLLQSLDNVTVLNKNFSMLSEKESAAIQGTSSLVNAIGDLIRLQQALQDGDEWAIASSATSMIDNGIEAYNHFNGTPGGNTTPGANQTPGAIGAAYSGAAASIVGLGMSVKQMADAFDDGDAIVKIQASLNVVQSGLSTYVAVSKAISAMTTGTAVATGAAQTVGEALPAIGCAIGVAQGLLAIADGDIQGGTEQIGLAIATTILMSCGPYGWIGALVLQIGNATRNCDGQIIDTENIEEFTDNIAPAGDEAAHAAIVSIEKPAEWGNDIYEDNIYYSGYDVDMLAEIGVDIPEDLKPQFGFVKMNAEFFNPLRYAQYFEDLDEMSLSDIWDSLFISQSVVATIALFHKEEPPQASVRFTLGDNGQLAFNVGGDKSMRPAAESYGAAALKVMEYYQQNGGRLLIDGSLPNLGLVGGSGSTINYQNETGGQVSVMLGDMANSLVAMQSVLYARDRGDRLDSAVAVSRDALGEIDFAQVDRIMAGYGFKKEGMTYTYGETKELTGFSYGSGVFNGGGNVGPQGQYFVARDEDITSLPLREDQRPAQTMGEIIKIVGLNNAFAGAGAELLAMALVSGGLLGLAAPVAAARPETANQDLIKPLDRLELEKYLQAPQAFERQVEEAAIYSSRPLSIPAVADAAKMQQFLAEHWGELAHYPERFAGSPESAYIFRQSVVYHDLYSDGSRPGWYGPTPREDDPLLRQRLGAGGQSEQAAVNFGDEHAEDGHTSGQSITGHRVYVEPQAVDTGSTATEPVRPAGPAFVMAEDSTLRFLLTELLEDTTPGSYGQSDEVPTFVAFGQAVNGRVYREANGDIRFAPTPGFIGTGSFTYTVRNAVGELIEKQATIQVENVNDPPLLKDDSFTLTEGQPFYLDTLLVNDTDPEGDSLSLDHLRGVTHGEIALLGGRLAFIPVAGYHGEVTFSYWVYDQAFAYPTMGSATLSYFDLNTGVAAADDRFLTLEDTALTVTIDELLVNDAEYDGENIAFAGLSGAVHGTVQEQPDGTILFTPEQDYAGTEAGFSYRVTDDSGHESTAWAAVEVLDTREAPVVVSATRAPIAEDEVLTFTPAEVAGFVHDADGDQLHLDFITNVTGGTIVTANGYYSFVPDPDYAGLASFDYRANDNHRGTIDGHLAFEILPVNDPIQIGQDSLATLEDQPVTVQVDHLLANDRDVDGVAITFAGVGRGAHGSAVLNPDNTVVFTPDADYAGSDAGFEYLVEDDAGLQSSGWVRVGVQNVNDAPAIAGLILDVLEDRPVVFDAATLAGLVRDADNDQLHLVDVTAVSGGTVAETDSLYTFTPDPNYHGSGALELTVADQHGAATSATINLNILGSDDPAVLGEDFLATTEEEGVATTISALLAGDRDEDGSLTFVRLGEATHGTVAVAGDQIQFTPEQDYFGNQAGFTYIVRDPDGYEATGQVKIEVGGVNDAPQIIAGSLIAGEDQRITFNAATYARFLADPDHDALTFTAADVAGGTVEESGGVTIFIPAENYHGPAVLGYSVADGHGGQASGRLAIELSAVDDPTVFGADAFVTAEEQPLQIPISDLLANDTDADGPLAFAGAGSAQHGEVRMSPGGTLQFIPEENYFGGQAGFSYQVQDAEGNRAAAWVKVEVAGVNDVPEIVADRLHLREDETIAFTPAEVAKFLVDADGDLLNLDLVTNVMGGSLTRNGSVYTFTPDVDFYGEAAFDYLASNSAGEELAGTLAITISPVNDLPETTYVSATGIEDHEVTIPVADLMAGAGDIEDGSNLRFAGIDSSLHGAVFVDSDQIVHFLPDQDFFGSGFFRYTVVDSEGGIGTGFAGIDLVGENDAPVAVDDERIVAWSNNQYENVYLAPTLLANDLDVDGDPLRIAAIGPAAHGTVTVDGQGNLHYLAAADDWVGVDRFTYEIADGQGGTASATAEIDVKINTSPDVYSELLFTSEDIISVLSQQDLLANDSDIDGDNLRITAFDQPEHCSVSLQDDGSIRFVPELNFNNNYPGQASFRYTVTDGISEPVTGVAFFDIAPVNDAPILTGERIEGAVEDNSFSFTVPQLMANDTDVEMSSPYEEDSIAFAGVWGAGHGSISLDPGSGTIFYVPDANFCGVETFTYAVVDSFGAESTVTSEIYVQPVNDNPVAEEDIGSTAEDSIWNSYSIAGLVSNDFDVDGDALTVINPYVIDGDAEVSISGGNLKVKPAWHEDRVVIGYTVADGNGGTATSKLTIPQIREHNFAPTFSGTYRVEWETEHTVWFNFHAEDKNGGNTWGNDSGDIVGISASAPNGGQLWDYGYSFRYRNNQTEFANGTVVLTAVDQAGATGSIFIRIGNLATVNGNYVYSPVVLDLDGDGVELQNHAAGATFDWNGDGSPVATGWVGRDDGLLVYDYDHDRAVHSAGELALREYNPGATTDLEGLRAFDTNQNDAFDPGDAEWQSFGVWQDKNSDGVTNDGEFSGLDELSINAIGLQSDGNFYEQDGNLVYGTATYETTDGTVHELADVGLCGDSIALTEVSPAGEMETAMPVTEAQEIAESAVSREHSEVPADVPLPSATGGSEPTAEMQSTVDVPETAPPAAPQDPPGTGEPVPAAPPESVPELPATPLDELVPAHDLTLHIDAAEISRQCLQLLSDMAGMAGSGSCDSYPVEHLSAASEIIVTPDYPPTPLMEEHQHDALAIA